MTVFLGVYRALYAYEPQTDEELRIEEDDMLYLMEKSEVDDWWTVKKRVIGADQDEPVGLVPKTYIEESSVKGRVVASYDYEQIQNENEELAFHEGDVFDLYDDRDPDWLLVRSQKNGEVGFVPGNYVETSQEQVNGGVIANANGIAGAIDDLLPPPQRIDRAPAQEEEQTVPTMERTENMAISANVGQLDDEMAPPSMPRRPNNTDHQEDYSSSQRYTEPGEDKWPSNSSSKRYESYEAEETEEEQPRLPARPSQKSSGRTWEISEVDGRKKRKATLTVSSEFIRFVSAKNKVDQEWPITDLQNYDNEKKHLFLEFKNPYMNIEIHTGTTDVAYEIMGMLGEVKGAATSSGLREVAAASKSKTKKRAKVAYDFFAESQDELTVREGDYVNILDDKTSKDWFYCESIETGKKGVIPAQFVETQKSKSTASGSLLSSLKNLGDSKSTKSKSRSRSGTTTDQTAGSWKNDAEQDISNKKTKSSGIFNKKKKSDTGDKQFPDTKKVRIWIDRTGTFKVEAQFLGCVDGKIHLHKVNGVKIAVAADKLSEDDILYVERLTGMAMDKYKPKKEVIPSSESKGASARDHERERRRRAKEREEREEEREDRERERRLREKELLELRRARDLLDTEREKIRLAQEKELPPVKPPRPTQSVAQDYEHPDETIKRKIGTKSKKSEYDWFEFFLNCGVDVNNCQRYSLNFEREEISEEVLPEIQPSLLRTLGLREGDILRVMKYLDNMFGRTKVAPSATGLFTEADGSLKVNNTSAVNVPGVSQNLLSHNEPVSKEDEAWTIRPAAKAEQLDGKSQDFSGSLQDLLDLQPLEPKKKETPQPQLSSLEPVKTGSSTKLDSGSSSKPETVVAPLDPFKTGGNNILPMATGGFVMMPVATGGLLPLQSTGGLIPIRTGGLIPQTTFGMPAGSVLPVQKTAGGLIPVSTGINIPQTTFGSQQPTMMPQTTFGANNFASASIPLQRTGGMLNNTMNISNTGMSMQPTFSSQTTGGFNSQPQMSFGNQFTGGANIQPQTTFGNQFTGGVNMQPPTSFGTQRTGGMNINPQNTFGTQFTGGASMQPQTSFGMQFTGATNIQPQTTFGNQMTGGINMQPQMSFGNQLTGGAIPQTSFGVQQRTGGFQPQSSFGLELQRTGGMVSQPQTSFNNLGGINQLSTSLQGMSLSQQPLQPQPLQNQPTGFGFGNGPQAQEQRQANIFNATADNPFGF